MNRGFGRFKSRREYWSTFICLALIALAAAAFMLFPMVLGGHALHSEPSTDGFHAINSIEGAGSTDGVQARADSPSYLQSPTAPEKRLPAGERIKRAFQQSEGKGFMKFLSSLGPGILAKKAALCEISQAPEKYAHLEQFGGAIYPLALQTLRFIEEFSLQSFTPACFDRVAQEPVSSAALSKNASFYLESDLAKEKRDRGLAAWEGMQLGEELQSLSSAVRFFFRMPGVFGDLLEMGESSPLAAPSGSSLRHLPSLQRLSCVARGVLALQERAGSAEEAEKCFKKELEALKEHISSLPCNFQKISPKLSNEVFLPILQAIWAFYRKRPDPGAEKALVGRPVFFPKETQISIFKWEKKTNTILYDQTHPSENNSAPEFSLLFAPSGVSLQSVCYVDNEEQVRKPVVIVQSRAQILCKEVVKYIAAMYKKPQKQIHVFSISLQTHALTRKDPEKTAYFSADKDSAELLAFYYIAKKVCKGASFTLAEFRPRKAEGAEQRRRVVYLPLFLSDMMASAIPMSQHAGSKDISAPGGLERVKRIQNVHNALPLVLLHSDKSAESHYQSNTAELGDVHALELDMCYAMSSIRVICDPSVEDCEFISYRTRKVEKEQSHLVCIGESARELLKQGGLRGVVLRALME
ncbi:uncharacterized protein NEMAJ01_1605 [Nematocida major]|uniref:uncharacterized protein n=1 Tax=Nematocida major TaxID=1912982 RepID=UPI00200849B1|nr:uncharacterized protein NEMAJ01_1605 [Nematocida major]KAH9386709.1 hypothetical protein NEMAJ01_1605 [Nematocida major]